MIDVFDDSMFYISYLDYSSDKDLESKELVKKQNKKEIYNLVKKHNYKFTNNTEERFFEKDFSINVNFVNKTVSDDYGYNNFARASREITGARPPYIRLSLSEFKKMLLAFENDTYQYFVLNNDITRYKEKLNTFSQESLVCEYIKVKYINKFVEQKLQQIKKEKNNITKTIYSKLRKKEQELVVLEDVEKVISEIEDFKDSIYRIYVKDIFLIDVDKSISKKAKEEISNYDKDKLISLIIKEQNQFHNDHKKGIYSIIKIYKNLRFILYVLTYLYRKYTHRLYVYLGTHFSWGRDIHDIIFFYPEYCPGYLLGKKKKNGEYDYVSVLKRILYTLKLYDFDEIINHNIISINYSNLEEVEKVTKILIEYGYKDIDNLLLCSKNNKEVNLVIINKIVEDGHNKKQIKEIINDSDNKYAKYQKAIDANTFLKNYKDIIVKFDFVKYNLLLKERNKADIV